MDVDEEEEVDSTQRLRKVPDFGIEVDFDMLSGDEREVSASPGACLRHTGGDGLGITSEPRTRSTW